MTPEQLCQACLDAADEARRSKSGRIVRVEPAVIQHRITVHYNRDGVTGYDTVWLRLCIGHAKARCRVVRGRESILIHNLTGLYEARGTH